GDVSAGDQRSHRTGSDRDRGEVVQLRRYWSRMRAVRWRRLARRVALTALASGPLLAIVWQVAVRWSAFPRELLDPDRVESLAVLDSDGRPLRQSAGGLGGRERWVGLDRISPQLLHATLAAEDRRFYEHAGVDWLALVRSAWLNASGQGSFGGST